MRLFDLVAVVDGVVDVVDDVVAVVAIVAAVLASLPEQKFCNKFSVPHIQAKLRGLKSVGARSASKKDQKDQKVLVKETLFRETTKCTDFADKIYFQVKIF